MSSLLPTGQLWDEWWSLSWAAVAQGIACYGFDVCMFNEHVKCNCKQVNSVNAWLKNTGISLLITILRIRFFALAKSQDPFAELKLKTVVLYSIHTVWWRVWRECNFNTKVTGLWAQHFRYVETFGNLFMDKLPGTWKTPNNILAEPLRGSLKIQGNLSKFRETELKA